MTIYDYDFGDSWSHYVLLEGILLMEKGSNTRGALPVSEHARPKIAVE